MVGWDNEERNFLLDFKLFLIKPLSNPTPEMFKPLSNNEFNDFNC